MTDKARALAHQAIGCECKLYSGKHDEICERFTAALMEVRNEALEEALKAVIPIAEGWGRECVKEVKVAIRAMKDRP